MAKISGWTKLPENQWVVRGEPTWKNNRTGKKLFVSHVEGGGGVVYAQTSSGDFINALSSGYGFRTYDLALKWAANYRKVQK